MGGRKLNVVDIRDSGVVLGMAHSGGVERGENTDAKQDNPERVSLLSSGEGRDAAGLARVHFEK